MVKRSLLRKPQGLRWTGGVEWLDLNGLELSRFLIDFSRHLVTSLIVCAETSESGDPPDGAAGGGTNSSRVDTGRRRPGARRRNRKNGRKGRTQPRRKRPEPQEEEEEEDTDSQNEEPQGSGEGEYWGVVGGK